MKVACTCKHEFQDREHGPGIRVANPVNKTKKDSGKDGSKVQEYRCTVCGSTHHKTVS